MDVRFRRAVAEARCQGDLYFAALLSEDRIPRAFGTARWFWQSWICTPTVTTWVFLAQCLSADHSCREAVAQLIAWRLAQGLKSCSPQTGAYCPALVHRAQTDNTVDLTIDSAASNDLTDHGDVATAIGKFTTAASFDGDSSQ
jgi:hypothetical protein